LSLKVGGVKGIAYIDAMQALPQRSLLEDILRIGNHSTDVIIPRKAGSLD
jgi:hypothetical protein